MTVGYNAKTDRYFNETDDIAENTDERLQGGINRSDHNLQMERNTIDSWDERFKNDYRQQMTQGANMASGNMQADASAGGGFNAAQMMGAQQAGGDVQARNNMQMVSVGRSMNLASEMAAYEQSQNQAMMDQAFQDLQTQADIRAEEVRKEQERAQQSTLGQVDENGVIKDIANWLVDLF